jgi:flagellar M-ring protein FliF
VKGILDIISKLGPQRLAAMGAVTLSLVGFFAFVIARVSQPTMVPLYTEMSYRDSSAVIKELEARGVKYELRQDGSTILAPQSETVRLRMDLAGKGLPSGGGMGYEIFDKGDAFSTTAFVQNVNHVRALEGELSRSIGTLDRVSAARVHLVLPERQLFSREKNEARASIVLKTRGDLDRGQVRAIRHLVATAVPNLKPEHVSVVDDTGKLLADGAGESPDAQSDDKRASFERRLRGQVEDIVASVVGGGRSRVQVAADMDFNRVQQTSESYDPESKVIRSTQNRSENQTTSDARDNGQVTAGNQLPAVPGAQGDQPTPARDASNKNEETINYEISRTTRTEVLEGGRLKRLSVAVLVDGTYVKGADGSQTYQPRSQEELDRITALVRSAIGFEKARGDQIEVVNLRFADGPPAMDMPALSFTDRLLNFSKDDVMRLSETAILGVLSLFVLLLVVRPLLRQVTAKDSPLALGGRPPLAALAGPAGQALLGGAEQGAGDGRALQPHGPSTTERMIEASQINGSIQAKSVERVGDLVQENPQETIAILRQYIHAKS